MSCTSRRVTLFEVFWPDACLFVPLERFSRAESRKISRLAMENDVRRARITSRPRIETYTPQHRSVVATPMFWVYILAAVFLALVVVTQMGWVSSRKPNVAHVDLNAPARPDPGVSAE